MKKQTADLEASLKMLGEGIGRNREDIAARKDVPDAMTGRVARLGRDIEEPWRDRGSGRRRCAAGGVSRAGSANWNSASTPASTPRKRSLPSLLPIRKRTPHLQRFARIWTRSAKRLPKPPEVRQIPDIAGRLLALEKKISSVGERAQPARDAALAVSFAALTRAAERGEPFVEELTALKTVAPAALDLALVEDFAAKGTPSLAALRQSFPAHARSARKAVVAVGGDDTLVDQFFSRARSVVRIERLDAGAEGGAPDILSLMAERLDSGDLTAALEESANLPDAVRTALGPWLGGAQRRRDLDDSIKRLSRDLAGILARADAPQPSN